MRILDTTNIATKPIPAEINCLLNLSGLTLIVALYIQANPTQSKNKLISSVFMSIYIDIFEYGDVVGLTIISYDY